MNTNSRWTEIKLRVPTGWQELVADSLGQAVCTTVQIGDHDPLAAPAPPGSTYVRTYIPTSQDSPAWRSALQTTLQDLATRVGVEELGAIEATYTILPQEDYANSWKKSWKAFRLRRPNGSLRVEPPWSALPDRDGETRLILEPGGAFGSGRHATTRTCLGVVLERLRGEERVLDAGSGSGILAVTSVLLGAAQATGFDVD
ncbi:MAG TPA: 50S ribosomal protein L11 methyltransferase, partial [Planctomycetota bacterium]|nr:50S ribosomal protein L11 methyltransferase [Planctomycetota bacterium]